MSWETIPNRSLGISQTTMSFAERIARSLAGVPTKAIARVAGVTPKAAERWKAAENAPASEQLMRLCAEFDEVWSVVRQQSCRDISDAERMLDQMADMLKRRAV